VRKLRSGIIGANSGVCDIQFSLINLHQRSTVAKYDMTDIHSSPIPLPAGRKIYMNEEWNGDENLRNLYQQIAGRLNYAAQLQPELMISVSQLSRVMSCPT